MKDCGPNTIDFEHGTNLLCIQLYVYVLIPFVNSLIYLYFPIFQGDQIMVSSSKGLIEYLHMLY